MLHKSDRLEEWPGQFQSETLLRLRETNSVRRMLLAAAAFSLMRVAILPYLMRYAPPGTFGKMTIAEVVQDGLILFGTFAVAAIAASAMAMTALLMSTLVFGVITYFDYQTYSGWMDTGSTNKIVTSLLLLRAFMNAVLSKTA